MRAVNPGLELLLAAAAAGAATLWTRLLLQRSPIDPPRPRATPRLREAAITNTLGFLLIGSIAASSALLVDTLCRMVELPG